MSVVERITTHCVQVVRESGCTSPHIVTEQIENGYFLAHILESPDDRRSITTVDGGTREFAQQWAERIVEMAAR